jgi:hypothetical protein
VQEAAALIADKKVSGQIQALAAKHVLSEGRRTSRTKVRRKR